MAKIGYVVAGDLAQFPFASIGDYINSKVFHDDSDRGYLIIGNNSNVTNNSGDALFTAVDGSNAPIAHGLTTNDRTKIRISSSYEGQYYANVINSTTFKLKLTTGGGNIPFVAAETALFWEKFSSHDAKGFSVGEGSEGYQLYQNYLISGNVADLADSYAYVNHNADGTLKNTHGDLGNNYTGPIGNRYWFHYPDTPATVTNNGGDALFTCAAHGMVTGRYIKLKDNVVYAPRTKDDYYYVEVISSNTFKLKTKAAGTYIPYVSDQNVLFALTLGSSAVQTCDVHGTPSKPVEIVNAPGGQTTFRKNWESATSYGFSPFGGSTYVHWTGAYNPVKGYGDIMYRGHDAGYAFSNGKYGFQFQFYNLNTNNSIFAIGEGNNHWEVDYTEVDGGHRGFAGIMCKRDYYPGLGIMHVKIHDCFVHSTHGEGFYISQTQDNVRGQPQVVHAMKVHIYNNRICNTGVEACQVGQQVDGCIVENNVIGVASLTHMSPFFTGQSQLQQISIRTGESMNRNNIFFGGTVNMFQILTNRADEIGDPSKAVVIKNSAYHKGRGRLMYCSLYDDGQTPVRFKDVYVKDVRTYDALRNHSQPSVGLNAVNYYLDSVTPFFYNNVNIDVNMSGQDFNNNVADSQLNMAKVIRDQAVPDIAFVKSGFEGIDPLDMHTWFQVYNATHPLYANDAVTYNDGSTPGINRDWVFHNGEFYKCILTHAAASAVENEIYEPQNQPTYWEHILWDLAGNRSDVGEFTTAYSNKPPLDLRLAANNFYNAKGMGLYNNAVNDQRTYIKWQWCYNNGSDAPADTHIMELPVQRKLNASKSEIISKIGAGNFVRRQIVARDVTGRVTSARIENWLQINA